jgi:hypothetical protein
MQEFNEYLRARCYGEAGMYTPDINELETHKRQLIFVMDDMMTGGKYHDYITETNLFGRWPGCSGYTEDEYTFLQRRLEDDAYGVVLSANYADDAPAWAERTRHGKPVTKAKIWGQVYSIRPFQFIKLDFLKENGVQFIRKRVNITIPIQKAFLKPLPEVSHEIPYSLECWMYTGLDEYFKDLIDNGFMFTPVTTVEYKGVRDRPWLKRYYLYRNVQKQYNY